MRTKTLLTAIAALAAGITISNAQVYSANVVGYAQTAIPSGQYVMMAAPFQNGATNTADVVFKGNYTPDPGYLPDGTLLLKWNGSGYTGYTYDTSVGADANNWYNDTVTDVADTPTLAPGEGFFLITPNGKSFTNTYSGAVAVNVGATNTLVAQSGVYNMLGSVIPASGAVSNSVINFYPPDGTLLLKWGGNGFTGYTYDTTVGADENNWYNDTVTDVADTPTINVGEGFFVIPNGTWNWKQSLSGN